MARYKKARIEDINPVCSVCASSPRETEICTDVRESTGPCAEERPRRMGWKYPIVVLNWIWLSNLDSPKSPDSLFEWIRVAPCLWSTTFSIHLPTHRVNLCARFHPVRVLHGLLWETFETNVCSRWNGTRIMLIQVCCEDPDVESAEPCLIPELWSFPDYPPGLLRRIFENSPVCLHRSLHVVRPFRFVWPSRDPDT